jgi:hypothetical protein
MQRARSSVPAAVLATAAAVAFAILDAAAQASPRPFDFRRDTFAFPNETYWEYRVSGEGGAAVRGTVESATYTRRCLVLCRSAVQFHRFARFEPGHPRLPAGELTKRLRRIASIPAWRGPLPEDRRVGIPGFADLRELSSAHPDELKAALGQWWPTYWRYGNWRMAMPFPRKGQAATAALIEREIDRGGLPVAFLTRFRPMNHAVVVFGYRREKGVTRFLCYDPNHPGESRELRFDRAASTFEFPRTPYWGGGPVNVFLTYRWPLS